MRWIELDAPEDHKLLAAVFRPAGAGPFPVVVILHSSGGFFVSSIFLGQEFAAAGFLAVAGCWFAGMSPVDPPPPTPLVDCPKGPAFAGATLDSIKYADAIVKVARILPGADGKRVGLIGQSRGATASILLASTGAAVQAVVADSASYTKRGKYDSAPIGVVQNLAAPLLILHGTADQTVNVQEPRDYELALRRLNKPYDVRYYDGSAHVLTRKSNQDYADAVGRAIAFFNKYLTS